jgi:hypothetical protein
MGLERGERVRTQGFFGFPPKFAGFVFDFIHCRIQVAATTSAGKPRGRVPWRSVSKSSKGRQPGL